MDNSIIVTTPEQLASLINDSVSKAVSLALAGLSQVPQEKQAEYLTRSEVRERLKISYPTLREWTKRGLLNSSSIGGRIYYAADQLEKAMKSIPNSKSIR